MENQEPVEELYTSDEVDYIVKKVKNHQANMGILIAVFVVAVLYIINHLR